MSPVQFHLVHSIPGRIRVRLGAIAGDRNLARALESRLLAQDGVRMVRANHYCASLTISFNPEAFKALEWLEFLNLDEVRLLASSGDGSTKLPWPLASLRRGTFAFESLFPIKAQFALATISLFTCFPGFQVTIAKLALTAAVLPILNRALQTFLEERRLGADALDGVSCLLLIKENSFVPAALMIFLIELGEFIRDWSTRRCQQMISHQQALSQRSAWLIQGKHRVRMPVLELRPGDKLVVYPGELIAFEGKVLQGQGSIIPASPEVDFEPRLIKAGDLVSRDTLLLDGKIYLRYERNTCREPLDAVRAKQARRWMQRTRMQRFALHTAYGRVTPLLSLATLVFIATKNLHKALAIICFDFITGIRISIPTAILSSLSRAGKYGAVMRNAGTLERLSEIDTIIFARSGTLTQLKPRVTDVFILPGFSLEQVTRLAAAIEQRYNHAGAFAIYNYAKLRSIPVPDRTASDIIPGLGISGKVEGRHVLLGSTRLMQMHGVGLESAGDFLTTCIERGDSRLCVAIDGNLAGVIAYQDPLRHEAAEVIEELRAIGINEIAMMTSGSQMAAEKLAAEAGIEQIHARALPSDMCEIVKSYKMRGLKVAVVGDDIADSLALEQADVAVTLGHGADIARYRADVILTSENLGALVEGILIARQGMDLARQNLLLVSIPNWLGLFLGVSEQADVLLATLLNNGSVIVGALNGLRPLLDSGQFIAPGEHALSTADA